MAFPFGRLCWRTICGKPAEAGRVIVLTSEGIAERGSHEELIKAGGMYAELYQYQFRD